MQVTNESADNPDVSEEEESSGDASNLEPSEKDLDRIFAVQALTVS